MSRPAPNLGLGAYDTIIDADVAQPSVSSNERQSLQFHDFHSNDDLETGRKPLNSSSQTPFGTETAGSSLPFASKKYLWSIEYYAQFFEVTTAQVSHRCTNALFPRENFFDILNGNPDLYAPIWIATSVVTVLYFSSTIAGYLAAHVSHEPYSYQFSTLPSAATLIYGYTFCVPVICWGVLRWYKCEPSLLDTICLYGYSNTIWILVALVSISPIEYFDWTTTANIVRWAALAVGYVISGIFLTRNLLPVLNRADAKTSRLLLIGVVGFHTVFALAIKILFFAYSANLPAQTPEVEF